MNNTIRHLLLCIGIACSCCGDSLTQETVVLENGVVELTVKIHGGALSGFEFGTSPLGIPFEEIGQVGNIMGFPTLHTLAPGGEIQTSFYLFISRIPDNFPGIESITLENQCLKLKERTEGAGREINLHCGTL